VILSGKSSAFHGRIQTYQPQFPVTITLSTEDMTPTREQLWDFRQRDQNAVRGPIWVDTLCMDCDLCREIAPTLFRRNNQEAVSYVFKQPESENERRQAEDAIQGCCVGAIHSDGDSFDWVKHPPMKAFSQLNRIQKWIRQARGDLVRGRIRLTIRSRTYFITLWKSE
jgi:ferredoxin